MEIYLGEDMKKSFIERLWPLPPVEKRRFRQLLLLPEGFTQTNTERDGAYLCHQAGVLVERVGLIFLALVFLDFFGHWGFILNHDLMAENKAAFFYAWGRAIGPVTFWTGIIYYSRIRLSIDIKDDSVPSFMDFSRVEDTVVKNTTRRAWILQSIFFIFMFLFLIPHIVQMPIEEGHFLDRWVQVRSSLLSVFLVQGLFALFIGKAVSIGISSLLILEKAIRSFDRLKEDLENG